MRRHFLLCAIVLGISSSLAGANIFTHEVQISLPHQFTNWNADVELPQFDTSLGTLVGVYVELAYLMRQVDRLENLNPGAIEVTVKRTAEISLTRNGEVAWISSDDEYFTPYSLSGFDGTMDFAGTSGIIVESIVGDTLSLQVDSAPDLAIFAGTGAISLAMNFYATTLVSGGGNILTHLSTSSEAELRVVYQYVPEPASMLILALGGFALMGRTRRRAA